jgi:GntR family transcriptional regulator
MPSATMIGMAVTWEDFETKPSATYEYVQLADFIESQIKAGRLAHGDRIPAQRDLAALTGTSTELAGRAMGVLRDRGLVETSRKGTFVTASSG